MKARETILTFKSKHEIFIKEKIGKKPNTVRYVDMNDPRFKILKFCHDRGGIGRKGNRPKIAIEDEETGEIFTEYIQDITFYNDLVIISWYSPYNYTWSI